MNKKFSVSNIKSAKMNLQKVSAEKIEKEPTAEEFTVKRSDKYEILELDSNSITLMFISKVFLEPEAMFSINLEYKASFEFSHKIDKKFIEKNINELLQPIGSEISYVTSTLTKLLVDNYFIMPPIISID